jgi:hypothetical protein
MRRVAVTVSSMITYSIRRVSGFGTNDYASIPSVFDLKHVIVIHRHGDRSQITRSLGPKYPESADVSEKWRKLLPSSNALKTMLLTTGYSSNDLDSANIEREIYNGWDAVDIPYAQLTEKGYHELVQLGRKLRWRYSDSLLPDRIELAYDHLYCRSTHMCRTIQSLRSLLVGLFDVEIASFQGFDLQHHHPPTIVSRINRGEETLFPQAEAVTSRRKMLLARAMLSESIEGYDELHEKIKDAIGSEKINWILVKEVLTCHATHDINVLSGINDEDVDKISNVAGWIWGVLFKVNLHRGLHSNALFVRLKDRPYTLSVFLSGSHPQPTSYW